MTLGIVILVTVVTFGPSCPKSGLWSGEKRWKVEGEESVVEIGVECGGDWRVESGGVESGNGEWSRESKM